MQLTEILSGSPYLHYAYAYPHKSAYRHLEPARALQDVWRHEPRQQLFCYVHIPFCTMRCGFCNLLTLAHGALTLGEPYLQALDRQIEATAAAMPDASFARFAIGGGTPSVLSVDQLVWLFARLRDRLGIDTRRLPGSLEVSPGTVTEEKVALLAEFGISRVSIGVQSFQDDERKSLGRPEQGTDVDRALNLLSKAAIHTLNIDLIYGMAEQSTESWRATLQAALHYAPGELYLYPLYVRPLTGLSQKGWNWDDARLARYREGRDLLLERGYRQLSMRCFRRADLDEQETPDYCCQDDGMVGLGAGARSYTRDLHYCTEYGVKRATVKSILQEYIARDRQAMSRVDYGFCLNAEEQRRRYLVKALLRWPGVEQEQAGRFPELLVLREVGLAKDAGTHWQLTALGLERSDAIAPWLFSPAVRDRMEAYELA